jgi:uncharacterized Zn-binding protein involved in type VI secretion
VGMDTHIVLVPSPGGPVPTPMPMPFDGPLDGNLASTVYVGGRAAALVDSTCTNTPPHIPSGGPFQTPPSNRGRVAAGSATVFIDNRAVARGNDPVEECNDPMDQQTGHIIATTTAAFAD